jgi:hypothetical protein
VTSLPDAERDACDVVRALAGLSALLNRTATEGDPALDDDARRVLAHLAEDGGVAARRVSAYLRSLRGAGDGYAVAVPPRLGQWREWVPPRGMVFGDVGAPRGIGKLPQPRRCDPGE